MTEENTQGAEDKSVEAKKIVRNHAIGSVAAGILPVPLLDIGILTGIQVRMVSKLAKLYDVDFSEQRANAVIGSLAGTSMAATGSLLLSLVPGVGRALVMFGNLTFSPASTYAIGKVFIKHFESGGTFWNIDESKAQDDYKEGLAEGKKVVEQSYAGVKP